jgi:hypothetical protein
MITTTFSFMTFFLDSVFQKLNSVSIQKRLKRLLPRSLLQWYVFVMLILIYIWYAEFLYPCPVELNMTTSPRHMMSSDSFVLIFQIGAHHYNSYIRCFGIHLNYQLVWCSKKMKIRLMRAENKKALMKEKRSEVQYPCHQDCEGDQRKL